MLALERALSAAEAIEAIAHSQHDAYLICYTPATQDRLAVLTEQIQAAQAPAVWLFDHSHADNPAANSPIAIQGLSPDEVLYLHQVTASTVIAKLQQAVEQTRAEQTGTALWSADQLRHYLEIANTNIGSGIIISDATQPDNPIVFVNPGFTTVTGYTAADMIGQNCRLLQGPDTNPQMVVAIRQAIATRTSFKGTLLNYRKDGIPFWNELTINPVWDDAGNLLHFIGLQVDVTSRQSMQASLSQLQRHHDLILNSLSEGIYGLDLNGSATFINQAAAQMLGYTVEELIGQPIGTLFRHPPTEHSGTPAPSSSIHSALQDGSIHSATQEQFWHRDGFPITVEFTSTPIWEQSKLVGAVGVFRDISERQRSEQALRDSEERYALAVQGSNDGIWDWNLQTGESYFSPRWKAILGCQPDQVGNTIEEWFSRIHPEDVDWVKAKLDVHLRGLTSHFENEHRIQHQSGDYRWVLCRGLAVWNSDGQASRIAGSLSDVTHHKQAEDQILHGALHDALTGLPNRTLLIERLQHAIHLSRRDKDYRFALLCLDLDRFKVVNDSLGHSLGDALLVAIAQRLASSLDPSDTIARLGGDEFVILLEDVQDFGSVTATATKIQQELAQPFNLNNQDIFTTASIGIALSAADYERSEDLLRDADTAMYRAKAQGRARYEIFREGMHDNAVALLKLETDLRRALARQEFELYFQPIVSIKTERIHGFEVLLRWQHPKLGFISPADFIPVAEETGLIIPIGRWVMHQACKQLHQWQKQYAGPLPITLSINLSGKQFTPDLIKQIQKILRDTHIESRYLKLEITESVLMDNAESAATILAQIQALGLQLSIDDFGTGYSSLGYLHRFPIDTLKVDRSFISRIDVDGEQLAIVRTIITLAWNLGMDVVAEGVETLKQLAQLKALQCEYGQGYFFYKPLDTKATTALIEKEFGWFLKPAKPQASSPTSATSVEP